MMRCDQPFGASLSITVPGRIRSSRRGVTSYDAGAALAGGLDCPRTWGPAARYSGGRGRPVPPPGLSIVPAPGQAALVRQQIASRLNSPLTTRLNTRPAVRDGGNMATVFSEDTGERTAR